ncbi:MAG: hypothetical protein KAR31_10470, partial [Candidatus Omnitrophica bacterium]|nr:hypothetical protein [Candidatus Omnitrophota bacterium]
MEPLKGEFSFFVLDRDNIGIREIILGDNGLAGEISSIKYAVTGPVLRRNGKDASNNISEVMPPLRNNEVTWPKDRGQAFSIIGKDVKDQIVQVTMMGNPDVHKKGEMNLSDINQIVTELGLVDAILLGVSADAQQYIRGEKVEVIEADAGAGSATGTKGRSLASIIYGNARSDTKGDRPSLLSVSSPVRFDQSKKSEKATKTIIEIDARAIGNVADISAEFLDWLKVLGTGTVWLKAPWERSPTAKVAAKYWQEYHHETLQRQASGYEVHGYNPDSHVAESDQTFKCFVRRLKARKMDLMTDFVTNHMAIDAPALIENPGLGIVYDNERDYILAVRSEFPRYGQKSDNEILELLKAPLCQVPPFAFIRHPADSGKIIRRAKNGPGELSYATAAQLNLLDKRARRYMIKTVVRKIADLTLNGGLRADLAFTGLRRHIRELWGWDKTDAEISELMPKEFLDELMQEIRREYPSMTVIGETYEFPTDNPARAWEGRAGRLQEVGIKTYDKYFYDLLLAGDMARARGYLFFEAPADFLRNSVHFISNHDILPALDAFGTPERAMAASLINLAIEGYSIVTLMDILGMRIPSGTIKEMKSIDAGIYKFQYPSLKDSDPQMLRFFGTVMSVMANPIFRQGEMFSAKLEQPAEHALGGLMPVIRHLEGVGDGLVVVNHADRPEHVKIDLNGVSEYVPSDVKIDFTAPGRKISILNSHGTGLTKGRNEVDITLPPFGYSILVSEKKTASSPITKAEQRFKDLKKKADDELRDIIKHACDYTDYLDDYIFKEMKTSEQSKNAISKKRLFDR